MSAANLLMKSYFAAWVKETPRTPGYVAGNVNTMHLAQLYDDFRAAEARIADLEASVLFWKKDAIAGTTRIRELEEFLRRLDRRGGLGLDVHAEIAAVLGTSQSDRGDKP